MTDAIVEAVARAIDPGAFGLPDPIDALPDYLTHRDEARYRARAAEREAKPVAWIYELFDVREVSLVQYPDRISWTVTPLFALPSPQEGQ